MKEAHHKYFLMAKVNIKEVFFGKILGKYLENGHHADFY